MLNERGEGVNDWAGLSPEAIYADIQQKLRSMTLVRKPRPLPERVIRWLMGTTALAGGANGLGRGLGR